MSELEYTCEQNNEILLCCWDYSIQCEKFAIILNSLHGFVFLKQSYFVFDVIMVNQNAKKIIVFSSSWK